MGNNTRPGTYLQLRHRLGVIVAKIARNFQQLGTNSTYREVELIDNDFQELIDDLPPTFRMLDFDRSWDQKLWYLQTHRYYIQTEILHFRIILHRPWILRKRQSERHSRSRTVTEDSAVTDYKTRQAFKRDVPDFFETLLGGSFRSFNVAMIAGISLLINPSTSHASEMKEIMRLFMEQHPVDPSADDFSQQEATIISTLHRRIVAVQSRPYQHSGNASTNKVINGAEPDRRLSDSSARASQDLSANQHAAAAMGGLATLHRPLQSPEDDQAQDMLNQWIIGQHQLGPGGDPTLAPFGIYPAQLRPFEQPFGQDAGLPFWPGGQANFAPGPASKATGWSAPFDQPNGMATSAYMPNNLSSTEVATMASTAMGQVNGPTQQYWEQMLNVLQPTEMYGHMPS